MKRCASSFARSRTSPTSRSSRSASAAITSSDALAQLRVLDDALAQRLDVARGSRSAASAARARRSSGSCARAPRPRRAASVISRKRSARCADLVRPPGRRAARRRSGPRRPRRPPRESASTGRVIRRDRYQASAGRDHEPDERARARAARAASPTRRCSSACGFATTSAPNAVALLEVERMRDREVRAGPRRAA